MSQTTNHRVVAAQRGGPEVLRMVEEPLPEPASNEVRVKMLAAGISGLDLMMRRYRFPGEPKVPFTPGVDVVGVADETGDSVSTVETGQTVAALLGTHGGYAEYVCVPAEAAVPVPPNLDPVEVACVVANYLTAYSMMHRAADVKKGDRILVHGAAGGVGTALLDLGNLSDLEMYGTASAHNLKLVSSLGATPIDYRSEDFVERIRALTGDGVDVVFDPVGGGRQLRRSYQALRKGGRLVWFGMAATSREGLRVIPVTLATRTMLAMIPDGKKAPMPPDIDKPNDWYRSALTTLLDYLAAGKIKPVVAARIPLAEAARAHVLLEGGGIGGKVVLVSKES
jgi:NADPH:quinone reductase-like Zn-dependent oxidoreductase